MENGKSLPETPHEKVKVTEAEIVVHGTKEIPVFGIKYKELESGEYHVGYSSYNLNFVFEWLEECFEITNCSTCKHNVESPPPDTCDKCSWYSLDQPDFTMWEKKK